MLFGISLVNPAVSSNVDNAARHAGKHRADAVESIGAHFPLPTPHYLLCCQRGGTREIVVYCRRGGKRQKVEWRDKRAEEILPIL